MTGRARARVRAPGARQRRACALLASPEGEELRAEVDALRGRGARRRAGARPGGRCSSAPSGAGRGRGGGGRGGVERLELEPKGRERKAVERELEEAAKRDGRRARTELLDLVLTLAALGFRDLVCVAEGATRPCSRATARPPGGRARARDPRRLREAAERCEQARQALELNVTEDLALSALWFRLAALGVGARAG